MSEDTTIDAEGTTVTLEQLTEVPTVFVRQSVPITDLQQAQAGALQALARYFSRRSDKIAGAPYVRYHTFDSGQTDVEVGVPLAEPAEGDDQVASGSLPAGEALRTWHLGSHDQLGSAYDRIDASLADSGWQKSEPGWEIYEWIDPRVEPDPASWPAPSTWRTRLVQPVEAKSEDS